MANDYCCYDILENDKYGRYAVAAKNFDPGDLIIREQPFAYGPKSDSPPVCLGCHSSINESTICSTCGWPVCNEICEKLSVHAENECKIFSEVKYRFTAVKNQGMACPQYECITPLRVLLAIEKNQEKWEKEIMVLESHEEERKKTDVWRVETVNVVNFLHQICKLKDRFSENFIHFACGLLETNAFAAPEAFGYEMRCIYPKSSLLLHSCAPNVGHYIFKKSGNEEDHEIRVKALVRIEKGQQLLLSYTQTLWPTLFRRAHLKEGKFFDCGCRRCADPTELGTNMSTLKCKKCELGWVTSSNPLDEKAAWTCNRCQFTAGENAVMNTLRTIQSEIDELDSSANVDPVASRETLIKKYQLILHPNHALLLNVKSCLSQLYGKADGYHLEDLPDILLEKKIKLCNVINQILGVVKPGLSRQRGWNLYELYAPVVKLARNQLHRKEIDEKQFRVRLEKAVEYLEEVALIFSHDDPRSPEGIIKNIALQTSKNLQTSIKSPSQ